MFWLLLLHARTEPDRTRSDRPGDEFIQTRKRKRIKSTRTELWRKHAHTRIPCLLKHMVARAGLGRLPQLIKAMYNHIKNVKDAVRRTPIFGTKIKWRKSFSSWRKKRNSIHNATQRNTTTNSNRKKQEWEHQATPNHNNKQEKNSNHNNNNKQHRWHCSAASLVHSTVLATKNTSNRLQPHWCDNDGDNNDNNDNMIQRTNNKTNNNQLEW